MESQSSNKIIFDKRVNENGRVEYLMNRSLNYWVNSSELDANTVKKYENERKRLNNLSRKIDDCKVKPEFFGFDRRVEPERILGAVTKNGVQYVLVKWKHIDTADLMPYEEVKKQYPQHCIQFLEEVMRRNVAKQKQAQ